MRNKRLAIALAGATLAAGIAGCTSGSIVKTSTSSPPNAEVAKAQCVATGGTWNPAGNGTCEAEAAPAPATSAPVATGPIGTTFTVTTTDDSSGSQVVYDVTADKVDQHAPLGAYETLNNSADHLVAVRFTIKGVTGQESDDANSDAVTIGTDTTEYQSSFIGTSDGPNFSSGTFEVSPGQEVSGWVTFEVPAGQSVASVQWQPGLDNGAATWTA